MSCNIYIERDLPKKPLAPLEPQPNYTATPQYCHLNVHQSKQEGKLKLDEKIQGEILKVFQDIRSIGMAKRLVKQPKHGHWNIKCGYFEYFHQYACEYLIGCISLAGARVSCVTTSQTKKY